MLHCLPTQTAGLPEESRLQAKSGSLSIICTHTMSTVASIVGLLFFCCLHSGQLKEQCGKFSKAMRNQLRAEEDHQDQLSQLREENKRREIEES